MYIIFIGGLADERLGVVKNYQKFFAQMYDKYSSEYFQWHERKKISLRLKEMMEDKNFTQKIVLIGHSYGAATATHVLKDIEIDLLITIDPVSRVWSKKLPKAKRWININSQPLKYDLSDYIAFFGGKWGKSIKSKVDEYHDIESSHGSFFKMMEKVLREEF